MRKTKMVYSIVMILEAMIAIVLLTSIVTQEKHATVTKIPLSEWQSDYIEYENDWHVNESAFRKDSSNTVIAGPQIKLPRGSYQVTVAYDCEKGQSFLAETESTSLLRLRCMNVILSPNRKSVSWNFSLKEDVECFRIKFLYGGEGAFAVNDIQIRTDSAAARRILAIFIILCVIADLDFYFRKKIMEERGLLLSLVGISMLVSVPLFMTYGFVPGHDISFHLMRVEGIAQELRNGIFLPKMQSLWMDGYGYPVSVYYGDLLLYVPAVMRVIGFSVTAAYKTFVFLINMGTVVVSYLCFRKIFKKRGTALLITFAYTSSVYRFLNVYARAAFGEYSAMMFFPIVALAVYGIYTQEDLEWKLYKKNSLILAIGMTGLIGTHILSTEMVSFMLVLICIF